jgi:hypothetical protein
MVVVEGRRSMSDWRIENVKFTRGAVLFFRKYARYSDVWDHDHCEGCVATFMESGGPDTLQEGYCTEDKCRWICPNCFNDLKDEMGWKLG